MLVSGCGAQVTSREGADTERGKELFTQKCGACHVLADAGTQGETGPNLDDGFTARTQGFDESTYFEVVLEQMKIPAPPMPDFDDPGSKGNYLPEEDLVNIAAYVASVAAKPTRQAAGDAKDPKALFLQSGCGSCHTLGDAETTGSVGPNLDDTKPSAEEAAKQIAEGGGGMPAYKGKLTEEQIQALAEYIAKVTAG